MTAQQQHVDLHRKLGLRRRALETAGPGAVYVPYVGDGDIAVEVYTDREVYAADNDPARVRTATGRLPDATAVEADVETAAPDFGDLPPLAVIDADAYAYPYDTIRHALTAYDLADTLTIFGTDGTGRAMNGASAFRLPDGTKIHPKSTTERRDAYNHRWTTITDWLTNTAAEHSYTLTATQKYKRGHMIYWTATLNRVATVTHQKGQPFTKERRNDLLHRVQNGASLEQAISDCQVSASTVSDHRTKDPGWSQQISEAVNGRPQGRKRGDTPETVEALLTALAAGSSLTKAAEHAGIAARTVYRWMRDDSDLAERVKDARDSASDVVEDALFEAAVSGNVTAQQVWLYNRRPDRWTDRRGSAQPTQPASGAGVPAEDRDLVERGRRVVEEAVDELAAKRVAKDAS